jgi:hypothetical protein
MLRQMNGRRPRIDLYPLALGALALLSLAFFRFANGAG